MSLSKKFYKDEPTIGKDKETGKAVVTKKEKASAKVNEGRDGMKVNEEYDGDEAMVNKHSKERTVLHHKHEIEQVELHHKHMKELLDKKGEVKHG